MRNSTSLKILSAYFHPSKNRNSSFIHLTRSSRTLNHSFFFFLLSPYYIFGTLLSWRGHLLDDILFSEEILSIWVLPKRGKPSQVVKLFCENFRSRALECKLYRLVKNSWAGERYDDLLCFPLRHSGHKKPPERWMRVNTKWRRFTYIILFRIFRVH